jgi:hypothetical protein
VQRIRAPASPTSNIIVYEIKVGALKGGGNGP